ncbi:MAG: hypothetical protein QOJ40_1298 [Verrucomicrobiota bacterium]
MLLWVLPFTGLGATQSSKATVVAKWDRFETAFTSRSAYANPVQDATLIVSFTSPNGETNVVQGFWDGGKTWRVRFSPNQLGRWQFTTACSDAANRGLHDRRGEFVCTAATGLTRFTQHGPVQVARDHRHFEHEDGTPFFWLADMVWDGPRLANAADWDLYASTRASQTFTVAQWSVAPGPDAGRRTAFSGCDRITVNPGFFQRLDAKMESLSRAGILGAIAPLCETPSQSYGLTNLPADQAAVLFRYVTARWGGDPVAWLVCPDGDNPAISASDWKKVGRAVFAEGKHAPVVLCSGHAHGLLDDFRDQNWVDAFAFDSYSDSADPENKGIMNSQFVDEWKKEPARPLIPFTPFENGMDAQAQKRFSSDEVRQALYLGLLMAPPGGVAYGGAGVVNWEAGDRSDDLPLWQKALFMPAAREMKYLTALLTSRDFSLLLPRPDFVPTRPDGSRRNIGAAATEEKDFSLIYSPGDRTLELSLKALPASASISWLNPRNSERKPAVAVVSGETCQFPTPDPGDWLLLMKKGK